MGAPEPTADATTAQPAQPTTAQARHAEAERGVRGVIHDLAVAKADLADCEATQRRRDDRLFLSLVEVLDAFERVLAEMPEGEPGEPVSTRRWAGNVRTVHRLLENAVRAQGVTAMEPATGEFDPHRHTALLTVSDPEAEPGTITAEAWRGYVVGDRVLRKPGVVVVGPAPGRAERG